MYAKLMSCMESIRAKTDFQPEVALILGSGLGDFADGIEIVDTVSYDEIKGFPVSTVSGHKGRFVKTPPFGGVFALFMQSRLDS